MLARVSLSQFLADFSEPVHCGDLINAENDQGVLRKVIAWFQESFRVANLVAVIEESSVYRMQLGYDAVHGRYGGYELPAVAALLAVVGHVQRVAVEPWMTVSHIGDAAAAPKLLVEVLGGDFKPCFVIHLRESRIAECPDIAAKGLKKSADFFTIAVEIVRHVRLL